MAQFVSESLLLGINVVSLFIAVIAVTFSIRTKRKTTLITQEMLGLHEDVRALCAGAAGLGERAARIEQRSINIIQRQDQLEQSSGTESGYQQALKLVKRGTHTEDLVSVCGLSQGEAELVTMMHRLENTH